MVLLLKRLQLFDLLVDFIDTIDVDLTCSRCRLQTTITHDFSMESYKQTVLFKFRDFVINSHKIKLNLIS